MKSNLLKKICTPLALALLLSACANPFSSSVPDNNTTILFEGTIPSGAYPSSVANAIRTSGSFRSAVPSLDFGNTLEYFATATATDRTVIEGDFFDDDNPCVFSFALDITKKWDITCGIRDKNNTDVIVMQDTLPGKTFNSSQPVFTHTFSLQPVKAGQGDIQLDVDVESSLQERVTQLSVTASPSIASLTKNFKSNNATLPKWARISASGAAAGSYDLILTFSDTNGVPVYTTIQTVTVLASCTTDSWVSEGSELISSDGFKLTEQIVTQAERNVFYVGRTSVTPDTVTPEDTNEGSSYQPLKTVSAAIRRIQARTTGGKCVVYVSGQIQDIVEIPDSVADTNASSIVIRGLNGFGRDGKPKDSLYGYADKLGEGVYDYNGININELFDEGQFGSVLSIRTAVPVTLDGITITKGAASRGAGMKIDAAANVTLTGGTSISGNKARVVGGGIYNLGTLTVSGASISNNTCYNTTDGSVGSVGGGLHSEGTVVLNDVTISGNRCNGDGGGINASNATITFNSGTITGNYADGVYTDDQGVERGRGSGGGVYASSGTFTMNGGEISGNSVTWDGGGMVVGSARVVINNGIIKDNHLLRLDSKGGAVYINSTADARLVLGENAQIPSGTAKTHDVYLAAQGDYGNAHVTIHESLLHHDSQNPIVITPERYQERRELLEAEDGIDIEAACNSFTVAQPADRANVYFIKENGTLAALFSFANGTYGTVAEHDAHAGITYDIVRYSYLTSDNLTMSVANPFADGTSISITIDDEASVSEDIIDRVMEDGYHTIRTTLTRPNGSASTVTAHILIKIKPVKVTMGSVDLWCSSGGQVNGAPVINGDGNPPHEMYIEGDEYPDEDSKVKTCLSLTDYKWNGPYIDHRYGDYELYFLIPTTAPTNYVYLTEKDSNFYFYTNLMRNTWSSALNMAKINRGFSQTTRTLTDLRANNGFHTSDMDGNGNVTTNGGLARARYVFSVTLTDD